MKKQFALCVIIICAAAGSGITYTENTPGGPVPPIELTAQPQPMTNKNIRSFVLPQNAALQALLTKRAAAENKVKVTISENQEAIKEAYNLGVSDGIRLAGKPMQDHLNKLANYLNPQS